MSDERIDYEELVSGTVDDIKDRVDAEGLDLEQVLTAEQANKDRVTLVEWLEERINNDGAADAAEDAEAEDDARPAAVDLESPLAAGSASTIMPQSPIAVLLVGLALGIFLTAGAVMAGAVPIGDEASGSTMTPGATGDKLGTYFQNNMEAFQMPPGSSITVTDVSEHAGSSLYEAQLQLQVQVANQTIDQTRPVYVTPNGRYVFFSPPIDTTMSVAEQTQQQTGGTTQPAP